MAWPQNGGIAYNIDDERGLVTVPQAIHRAKLAAVQGDPQTAHILARAVVRSWHLATAVAA